MTKFQELIGEVEEIDTSPVSNREISGWYFYGFAVILINLTNILTKLLGRRIFVIQILK